MDLVSARIITGDVARLAGFYEKATGALVVLTSSASRCGFGSQLDHYPFDAKADLCASAIENAPTPPLPPA
jgi:hypothetical protein